MAFTSKLIADYTEMINQQLDNIPVRSLEDFNVIIRGLENIALDDTDNINNYPAPLAQYLQDIHEYLASAQLYVEDERNYDEYKLIIKDRIMHKIGEFQSFTDEQKINYIQDQISQVDERRAFQQRIATIHSSAEDNAMPVITNTNWRVNREFRSNQSFAFFSQNSNTNSLQSIYREQVQRINYMTNFVLGVIIEQDIPEDLEGNLLAHVSACYNLLHSGVNLREITSLNDERQELAFAFYDEIILRMSSGESFLQAIDHLQEPDTLLLI